MNLRKWINVSICLMAVNGYAQQNFDNIERKHP